MKQPCVRWVAVFALGMACVNPRFDSPADPTTPPEGRGPDAAGGASGTVVNGSGGERDASAAGGASRDSAPVGDSATAVADASAAGGDGPPAPPSGSPITQGFTMTPFTFDVQWPYLVTK